MKKRIWIAALAALCASGAVAQPYPGKAIRIVVGFAPGGGTDTAARIIAKAATEALGQSVVVENRAGAGGNIAHEQVAKAAPDGHTLVLGTISHHGAFKMYKTLRYNPGTDLQSVILIAESFNVLMVRDGLPVKSVAELIAMARAQPGKLTYASAGSGSATHMAAELFKYMTKLDILGIPFKGGAPAQIAMLGGQVDVNFETAGTAWPAIKTGKVRALAVTLPARSPSFPDLPAIAEATDPAAPLPGWLRELYHY